MQKRLSPICIGPTASIRHAMQVITDAVSQGAPWGIAMITEGDKLLGVVTDGDIRKAILKGNSLEDPVGNIMTRQPLTVLHSERPDEILARFHERLRQGKLPENRFHHIITVDEAGNLIDALTPFELWQRSEVKIKTAAIIGLGYVGLTLALTLNEFGIRVIGIDKNETVLEKLKKGIPHFYENGLDRLLKKHVNKSLTVAKSLEGPASDIFVICVGTPVDKKGNADESYLRAAVTEVGSVLKRHDLVILRSTVPIGTCRQLVIPLLEKTSGLKVGTDVFLAFAPERTVEGKALDELKSLPQVIGGYNKNSTDYAARFFSIFVKTIVSVNSLEEAEAVKLLNNTFRDVSFGFANEAAIVLEGYDINARDVIIAANEGYVRNRIPVPSPGVGGACLIKDPFLFMQSAKAKWRDADITAAARKANDSMINFIVKKVDKFMAKHKKDSASATLFLMGIAFKGQPETSDIRYSTSVDILRELQNTYEHIRIYDPVAHREDLESLGAIVIEDPAEGFRDADCILVLNNHPSYKELDIYELANTARNPAMLFDPWGSYQKEQLLSLPGIHYTGL